MSYVREIELRYRPGRLVRVGPPGPFLSASAVFESLRALSRLPREVFLLIHLDSQNRPLCYDVASIGNATSALVTPKDVVRPLLYSGAEGCILVHNHPAGCTRPSAEDINITRALRQVIELCGLKLLDHIIIGDGEYTSFAEQGLL